MRKLSVIALIVAAVFVVGTSLTLAQAPKPPGVVILKGSPLGGVKFDHAKHAKLVGDKCETCHHASKSEKPAKAKQEKCQGCHEKTATAPMKTKAQAAFHDAMAKKGICVDCHIKENAAGKKTPVTPCTNCHKKENV